MTTIMERCFQPTVPKFFKFLECLYMPSSCALPSLQKLSTPPCFGEIQLSPYLHSQAHETYIEIKITIFWHVTPCSRDIPVGIVAC
jgi:hypothetical protein